MTAIVLQCLEDLKKKLQLIANLKDKVWIVYSPEELAEKSKRIAPPWAGIYYEGMRSASDQGKETHKIGGSADLSVGIIIQARNETGSTLSAGDNIVDVMDEVRGSILDTVAPTRHNWRFMMESSAGSEKDIVYYIQRWATPVQLVGRKR